MTIRRDAFVLNVMRANEWYHQHDIQQLHASVDKSTWFISGQMRDAHYEESNNEIYMGAGSFVAPGMKDDQLDDAFVYGYTFMGHEISHGFDNDGRRYDLNGNVVNWWTTGDSTEFNKRADAQNLSPAD
jgi:putative endopeptidase